MRAGNSRTGTPSGRRRGNALVITAVLLPLTVGFMAVAIDTGVVAAARSQLQTAADSAALAGAQQLAGTPRLQLGAVGTTDVAAALAQPVLFASYNKVLGSPAILMANAADSNTGTEDVVVGYMARPFDSTQPLRTDAAVMGIFNTVLIRGSRSATHGGQVPGYFSALWGNKGSDVSVTSSAAVVGVSGFQSVGGASANCLPIVLDKTTYTAMIQGQTTDQFTYNSATNTVSSGPDGITESQLYPVISGYPGNWCSIEIGVNNNSTSTLSSQIQYGVTPAQLATYPGGILQPDPTTGTIQFQGNPGISAGLQPALTSIIGKSVRIPIYDPAQSGGNGTNAVYTIVAFAPVRVMSVVFQGSSKYVIVQPAPPPNDPTVVWGGISNGPLTGQYRIVLTR